MNISLRLRNIQLRSIGAELLRFLLHMWKLIWMRCLPCFPGCIDEDGCDSRDGNRQDRAPWGTSMAKMVTPAITSARSQTHL